MKGTLELKGMPFHAFHGCFDFEREEGADYIVDFTAECDFGDAPETDGLEDTADYSALYDIISREMDAPANLIEHVAWKILSSIRSEVPQIGHMTVRIVKLRPPVKGELESATVTLSL